MAINHYIKNGDIVLEVGCGKGAFSRKIETPNYTGLEFSRNAIEIASKANIKILNEFVEDHSNSNSEIYDTVCSFQVLEHVAKPNSFIESCLKCLKPGGLLIFSVPSDDSFIGSLTNNIMNIPPHHVTRWTDKTLKYVADYFGIRLIDIHHEKLADVHKRLYAHHLILKSLENSLRIEKKSSLLEMSIP